ncbi:MAG: hypothetical protein U9Q99_01875 [Nanoarchaeota archaeon]|nr:hypothetical protein [Nanoarchaeota archaeon]
MNKLFSKRKNKGLSQIVSVMVLVLLTIVVIGIVWSTINTFVLKKLEGTESCYGVTDKVSLNNDWTCYNATSDEFHFSINIKDIDVDSILISIVNEEMTSSKIRKIYNESSIVANVTTLSNRASYNISLPRKESGNTYVLENVISKPSEISIAPIIGGNQCEITSNINNIYFC